MKQYFNILVKATLQRIKIHTLPWMFQEVDGSMVRTSVGYFTYLKMVYILDSALFLRFGWMDFSEICHERADSHKAGGLTRSWIDFFTKFPDGILVSPYPP